jgi:hypothetical protein
MIEIKVSLCSMKMCEGVVEIKLWAFFPLPIEGRGSHPPVSIRMLRRRENYLPPRGINLAINISPSLNYNTSTEEYDFDI